MAAVNASASRSVMWIAGRLSVCSIAAGVIQRPSFAGHKRKLLLR